MLVIEIAVSVLLENAMIVTLRVMLNLFTYAEFALLVWMFHSWGLFNGNKTIFISILIGFFAAWFAITVVMEPITLRPNNYFRILYSFTLVLFAVSTFNKMVVNHRGRIFDNAQFWICLGIIIFFTFFLLDNATKISLIRHRTSIGFRQNLQKIIVFTNVLVNLLYAVAVLWIPRKKNFMTSF